MKLATVGEATSFPLMSADDPIIEASGLPMVVLEAGRSARFTGGGGGGSADGHGAFPASAL